MSHPGNQLLSVNQLVVNDSFMTKELSVHFEIDSLGSDLEFTKESP